MNLVMRFCEGGEASLMDPSIREYLSRSGPSQLTFLPGLEHNIYVREGPIHVHLPTEPEYYGRFLQCYQPPASLAYHLGAVVSYEIGKASSRDVANL